MNFMDASAFRMNPNDPLAGMRGGKNLDKCCVERDICKQTCGMTSKACHESFKKCSNKICKGDQNCQLQAMMSDILSEPYDEEDKKEKYDPEATKCKGYVRGQKQACKCVAKGDWRNATEDHLKAFYKKFNPEKLTKKGVIKDADEVWKKWKGKEPELFVALATKYKDKAVEIREKPKPPPYTPPPKDNADAGSDAGAEEPSAADEPPAPAPPADGLDEDDRSFEEKRKELDAKKSQAAEDEDYDLADKVKEEAATLLQDEIKRLKSKKAQSIAEEEYAEAKRLKQRLARLEL